MLCAKAGAQRACVKLCTALKKIVVGLIYLMPLCVLVKAVLAYIAAGSCESCGVYLIIIYS